MDQELGEEGGSKPAGKEGPTDVELVRAYREGDIRAFEELHRRYVASIYRLVRRKLGDALLAEDIAQETFMKALRMMDRVDESFNFGGWVLTLRELQDMSYRQIARTLKMSESAVETLLYRARLRFKEEYLASQREGELSHEEAVPLLAPYLAGKLRRPQAEAVRNHIATCAKCARRIGRRRLKVQRRSEAR